MQVKFTSAPARSWGRLAVRLVLLGPGVLLAGGLLWCSLFAASESDAPESQVKITGQDGQRIVRSNGIANHPTGKFPNRGNPNAIRPQRYEFRMPLAPKPAEKPTPVEHASFGVAVNGVPFDPNTAEYWRGDFNSNWRYEANSGKVNLGLDDSMAHVQPNGAYHYHALPKKLLEKLGDPDDKKMTLLGYAADGFPIYSAHGHATAGDASTPLQSLHSSYRLKKGTRPDGPGGAYDGTFVQDYEWVKGTGELDECNGRTGVTPEYPGGTYYYVITAEFPFIPRYFRGTPDNSFRKGPPGGGPPRRGPPGGFGGPGGPPPFGRPPGPPPFGPPPGGPPPRDPPP